MKTDTSERGLENLIVEAMVGRAAGDAPPSGEGISLIRERYGGTGWLLGQADDYDREFCVDLSQLRNFLHTTQPKVAEALDLDNESPTRRKFLARLQGEISKRGVIDVLRKGIKDGPHHVEMFYGTPSPGNEKAVTLYAANRFTVTRQLRYSRDETQRALDLALFINGLPIATFELKNSLTKQTVEDAVEQYKRDRDPREKLFKSSSNSADAWCTLPWTIRKCGSARISKGNAPGFFPSIRAGTTGPAIRRMPTGSRPITCGGVFLLARA